MSKKALVAVLLAIMVPVISYMIVKRASDRSIGMPGRYYYDSVVSVIRDGKAIDDTLWHSVQDFKFQNQLGRTVSLSDLPGKVIVADFFFTRCPSICPKLTANIRKLQDALSSKDQFKQLNPAFIQFLSFSVDPERDSVSVLKAYGNKFGINPDIWWLLTGPKKEIYDFSINELKLSLADGEGVDSNFIHTQKIVLLDKEHVVRGYYNGLDSVDMNKMANDMVFIMLEKDKNYVSPLNEVKPILPIIIFMLLATAGLVIYLSRKPKAQGVKLKA
ncbi:MAG TPA: SCO family protein [Puia sp.]|nr:SCO family protein [Puia sp.]